MNILHIIIIKTIYWLTKLQIPNECSLQHSVCLTERGEGSSLQLEMSDVGSAELHCGILHPSFCCCHSCSRFPSGKSLGLRESVTSNCTLLSGPKIFSYGAVNAAHPDADKMFLPYICPGHAAQPLMLLIVIYISSLWICDKVIFTLQLRSTAIRKTYIFVYSVLFVYILL